MKTRSLLLLSLCLVPVAASAGPTDGARGFLDRPTLTGDWGGGRSWLADHGVTISVEGTQYYGRIVDGGLGSDWEYIGTADYRLKLDTGKAGLWPGGFIELHGESYWGRKVDNGDGTILPSNFDFGMSPPAGEGSYLSHVVITQFLTDRFAILFGKLDTSTGDANEYAWGTGDEGFMHSGFNLNPVTYLTSPYSTLGGGIVYLLGEDKQSMFTLMTYDGEGRLDSTGFGTLDEERQTVAAALRLRTNFFGKKGHQWFGALWGLHGEFNAQDQDIRILQELLLPGRQSDVETENSTWAFFYNFDQQLVSNPDDPEQGWGVFGRFGIADENTSVIRTFTSIGFGGTGLLRGRRQDRFGIGYYYMTFNDDRIELLLPGDDEHGFEAFYKLALTPWFALSAHVQLIHGAIRDVHTSTTTTVRGQVSF